MEKDQLKQHMKAMSQMSIDFSLYMAKELKNKPMSSKVCFFELIRLIGEENISMIKEKSKDPEMIGFLQNMVRMSAESVTTNPENHEQKVKDFQDELNKK